MIKHSVYSTDSEVGMEAVQPLAQLPGTSSKKKN